MWHSFTRFPSRVVSPLLLTFQSQTTTTTTSISIQRHPSSPPPPEGRESIPTREADTHQIVPWDSNPKLRTTTTSAQHQSPQHPFIGSPLNNPHPQHQPSSTHESNTIPSNRIRKLPDINRCQHSAQPRVQPPKQRPVRHDGSPPPKTRPQRAQNITSTIGRSRRRYQSNT